VKSYETFVMTLYEGIFEDAAIHLTDIRSSMELDLSYLRRAIEQRGLAFFTLTLPDYGHWIDRSLDHGSFLDKAEIPRGIPLYHGRPRLFWGILVKVFDTDGVLRPDADHWCVLLLRTLTQSLKKLEVPVRPLALKKTVKEFFDVEEHLPKSHSLTWDSDIPEWRCRRGHPLQGDSSPSSSIGPDLFGRDSSLGDLVPWDSFRKLCGRIISELGPLDYWELRPKHGPGAVSERGWISKYEYPTWPRKLGLWFPYDWFGSGNLSDCFESVPSVREPPSRLLAVPKTQKGPRLICAEPIAHQWMQQSIWRWLRDRIPTSTLGRSISFESQEASQLWALQASHDRSMATLDLSAASDRLSTRLVEYVFQSHHDLLDAMQASRTRAVEQTIDKEFPKLHVLRKFATMGSALTFPIQSIVFTLLSVWALRLSERREHDWHKGRLRQDFARVRVFGDDIIVPIHAYGWTKLVLHECGLLVNSSKSFEGVSFRESCGMDAFRGVDVTPARVHKPPYSGSATSMAALVEYTNNLYKKGFWHASNSVLHLLPRIVRDNLVVGNAEVGGIGLFSFGGTDLRNRKTFWDPDLQRDYTLRLAFTTRVRSVRGRNNSDLIQFFHEEPVMDSPITGRKPRVTEIQDESSGRQLFGDPFVTGKWGPRGPRQPGQSSPNPYRLVRLDGTWDWKAGSVASSPLQMRKLRVYL